jgi:putative ABC transport system substrate-binding protein
MRLEHEYVARKLNGEVTEFMPVTEPTKFELVINFKTAKALGLTIPPIVVMRADRVIR